LPSSVNLLGERGGGLVTVARRGVKVTAELRLAIQP
jgi:hypothetical protein